MGKKLFFGVATLLLIVLIGNSDAVFGGFKIRKPKIVEKVQKAADNIPKRAEDVKPPKPPKVKLPKPPKPPKPPKVKPPKIKKPKVVKDLQELTESAPAKANNAIVVEFKRGKEFVERRADTSRSAIHAETWRAFNVQNWEHGIQNPDQVLLKVLSHGENGIRVEVGAGVEYMKRQWWYRNVQEYLLSHLLEKPTYVVCGDSLPGPPIWYVNGILTKRENAVNAGSLIADRLGRRVHVLYNPSIVEPPFHTGLKALGFDHDDLSECVYDRIWPAHVVSRLDSLTESLLGGLLTKSGEKLQGNPTTRQLAYVLYHSDEPVSVVTHSQGCLIARNAFFTMALLSSESKARNNVAWVAAGLPLNDSEIWPRPKRTTNLDYRDDPVAKLIGIRGGGIEYNAADHDFMEKYVDQLNQDQVWPGSESLVVGRE